MRMNTLESEREQLRNNLKQAVRNCQTIKIGNRLINSSFKIKPLGFLDFTEEKYKDGIHLFRMESSIEIINNDGDKIEDTCTISFYARIKGINVEIYNNLITTEGNLIPYNWK